jgi:hypothetical protein
MRAWDQLTERLNKRPWYEKLWTRIIFFNYICRHEASIIIMREPRNQQAIDVTVNWIKDDIEFGYSTKTIYDKINLGQYNNTPIKVQK